MIDVNICQRLGWLYGKLADVAKPTAGAYGNDVNLPVMACTRLHNQLASDGKLTEELKSACVEVLGRLPAGIRPAEQANMEGQSAFALGRMQASAGAPCPSSEGIGNEMKEARLQSGLSQQEAARMAGITQAALSRIENGESTPRKSTIEKLLSLYDGR